MISVFARWFVWYEFPWCRRSAAFSNGSESGIFGFDNVSAFIDGNGSFRGSDY